MKIIWILISSLVTTAILKEKDPSVNQKCIFINKTKHYDICKADSHNIDDCKFNLLNKNRNYVNNNNSNNKTKHNSKNKNGRFKKQKKIFNVEKIENLKEP
jgi:hypothetical protein